MSHGIGKGRKAFTLVEVLASLALVGAVLPAAMAGITLAMGAGEMARQRTEAATLAAGKLAELVATGDWQDGRPEGDFGDQWPRYSWVKELAAWEEPGVSEVVLTVNWTTRGKDRAVIVTTLAYAGAQ